MPAEGSPTETRLEGKEPPLSTRQARVVLVLAIVVGLISMLRFDGPSRGYWDTYIAVPAMFMTGQAVDLHDIEGAPRFDYELQQRLPDDTFDPSTGGFGIASKDQRIGAAILFGAPFALFGKAAFRLGFAATWTLLFLFGFFSLRRILSRDYQRFAAPLFGALLLVFNPFSLYLDRLNGNLFGLSILVFLFYLLSERRPTWWLIGLVYGLLGGVRNEAIILAPMLLAFQWRQYASAEAPAGGPRDRDLAGFFRAFGAFTLAAFAGILPVLLWNRYAYGAMIIHPSQVTHLQGFRPTFPHRFFGSEFQFNGLLNWPFHDHLVRTPHFAFPTAMLWPLITIRSLGVPITALGLVGAIVLLKRRPFLGRVLWFWFSIVYLLFIVQENWEELKQTFMALHLFPLVAFVAAGLDWLLEGLGDRRRWLWFGAGIVLVVGTVLGSRLVDAPADERWYVRFPHAGTNDSGLTELPEERRKDWHYFYTHETDAEVQREREALTSLYAFPRLYRPVVWPAPGLLGRIAAEPLEREHRTLAIWSYIYE